MAAPDADRRLNDLRSITDSSLGRLGVDDLLDELLDRVRSALAADTAAVLLLEGGGEALVARAARGLEEEVRQGVRIPVGTGFAGMIAKRRSPVLLDRVDNTTVANPILWEHGIRTMLGVPLLTGADLVGVLHVGRLQDRPFTTADTELLQVAADRVANSLQSRRLAVETAAAEMLERGLMPTQLPRLSELEFAARYVPAETRMIGGDWFDAFVVPGGQLWLVTGDVAGHGLNAAVIMGRVKSALRAYTLDATDPEDVLERTDRKVQHFEMGTMVTVVCATAVPPYDRFVVSTAGHPPPVLAAPDRDARLLEIKPGPPLGADTGVVRSSVEVDVTPGEVLLLYTDGLVERRGEGLDEGLERLRRATRAAAADQVCRDVMHSVVGRAIPTDDIALLAVRRRP